MSPLPEPRLLLGPGPSPVHPRVLEALSRPPIGYLDPELFVLLGKIEDGLRHLFQTKNAFTLPLTGTGMAGMEFCLGNLIERGETVVIAVNGFFGGRMAAIAERLGANVVRLDFPWGTPVDPARVREACQSINGKIALVGCVHAETSTGVESDCAAIGQIAREFDALFVMDAVTSLGGIPVRVDDWNVDVAYSATQKCVGAPPGLAPVTLSARAGEKIQARETPSPGWFFDAKLLNDYFFTNPPTYHHTVPVNLYYALHEALQQIQSETLEVRWTRHKENAALLWRELDALDKGFTPLAAPEYRLPTLNAVKLSDNFGDEAAIRSRLLTDYGIEIGGGFGDLKGKLWRIGLMGHGSQARNVLTLSGALRTIL